MVGYEGLYLVSNLGKVKNTNKESGGYYGKILKPHLQPSGFYLQVYLYKDGVRKQLLVHKLVADAFISNPHNLPQVNHIDEDKTNNASNNLERCTAKQNSNHGSRNDRIRNGGKPVCEYGLDGTLIRIWKNASYIEEVYDISARTIYDSVTEKYDHCRDRIFKRYSDTKGENIKALDIATLYDYQVDRIKQNPFPNTTIPEDYIYNPIHRKQYISNILDYYIKINHSDDITYSELVELEKAYNNSRNIHNIKIC